MVPSVRTFRAPDARSALAAVKSSLGSEAVILGTRQIERGLFRPPEVEITASLASQEESAPSPARAARPGPSPASSPSPRQSDSEAGDDDLRRSVQEARRALASLAQQARSVRELSLPGPAVAEVESLIRRGVEPALGEELVRQALAEGARPVAEELRTGVETLLGEWLVPDRAPWLPSRPRIMALVGPTGVGKTTTAAKIAARALVDSGLRVALITVDTYRIGAAEQFARYGRIMNVPCEVARDPEELGRAVGRHAQRDLIVIDTAGRSTAAEAAHQAELVRHIRGAELHLVLSATAGHLDQAACAERYRPLRPERIILTKVDEAAGPGSVLSALMRLHRPVSAIANGQRVPEDLMAASSPELVQLILGPAWPVSVED